MAFPAKADAQIVTKLAMQGILWSYKKKYDQRGPE
jgi:hypothetical protein